MKTATMPAASDNRNTSQKVVLTRTIRTGSAISANFAERLSKSGLCDSGEKPGREGGDAVPRNVNTVLKSELHNRLKTLLLVIVLLFGMGSFSLIIGQTTYTWQGANNASWATGTNWNPTRTTPAATDVLQFNTGTTLTITSVPTQTVGRFVMSNNTNITLQGSTGQTLTIGNGTGTDLDIPTGSSLTIGSNLNVTLASSATAAIVGNLTVNSGRTYNTDGTSVVTTVTGSILNSGTVTSTNALKLLFQSGSVYQHTQNGGTIPTASWDANSTCLITGSTTTAPGGLGQSFGNFTWNCASQTGGVSLAGGLITVNGNFTVTNTNTGSLRLSNSGVTATLAIGKDFTQTGGTFYIGGTTGSNTWTMNVNGNFSLSNGTLDMNGNSGSSTLNVKGNFTLGGGTLTESAAGTCNINFNGSTTQLFSKTAGTISNTINFSVPNLAIVDFGTSVLNGSIGAFNLNAGGGIITANPDGLVAEGTNLGTIQTTTRTYSPGADYTYNGTSAQVTGTGLTNARNLTINNSAGVSLSAGATITGLLNMESGFLNLAGFNLSTGSLTGPGNITNNTIGTSTLTTGTDGTSTTYSGAITNGSIPGIMITALVKSGLGTLTLTNSAFTFTGTTIISGGELRLNPGTSPATFESPLVLNGTTGAILSTTGIASGTTFTSSSHLILAGNSTINLGSGDHSLIFAPSSSETWTSNTLTINGWTGTAGASGTGGKIFFGNPTTGLDNTQLAKISFAGYGGTPILLALGELVPPEITAPILSISGITSHGSSCINTAAAPITYTITNLGFTAENVSVVSDNLEFVVSGLSSTTIAGGGTATYQVTFTPNSSGARTATITVSSSTTGSNSPTSSLTGTGVAQPEATLGISSQTICQNGTATVSGASSSNGTILWTTDGAGGLSGNTTLAPTYTAAAGDAGKTVTLTLTVSSSPCLPAIAYYSVYVKALPTANAGTNQSVCAGGAITLSGSMGGGATRSTWSAPGGSFGDVTALNSTYTPAIATGTVILTLTADDPTSPCTAATSTMTVTVVPLPTTTGVIVCQRGSGELTASAVCPSGGTTDTGVKNAGTGANVSGIGTIPWSTPENITSAGSPYATAVLTANTTTNYLMGTNYGISIPLGATINGIQVSINRSSTSVGGVAVRDNVVSLMKNGTITGSNKAATGTNWPTTLGIATYGSSSDKWGTTWTAEDINNPNFGIALVGSVTGNQTNRNVQVDYMEITVNYTINGVIYWWTASSGGTLIGWGSPFNPAGKPGSPLVDTNTPGTTTFYAECSTNPGCRTAADFVIIAGPSIPTITPSGTVPLCTTSGGATVTLTSSSATGYQWFRNGGSLAGETNQSLTTNLTGDYTVVVAGSNGCTSQPSLPTTVASDVPTIATNATATATCFSGTDQPSSLAYGATTNIPTTYSISWDSSPTNNFAPVSDALPASPIPITVPANTQPGTYTGHITVSNADGCISIPVDFTITVNASPVATFSYASSSYCNTYFTSPNPNNPLPSFSGGGTAGTFSANSSGLKFVDIHTGKIDLAASSGGSYIVTNTVTTNGCTGTYDFPVVIVDGPKASISYSPNAVCNSSSATVSVKRTWTPPTTDGTGTYSVFPTSGLTINATSDLSDPLAGQITPSTSVPGTYTITYTFTDGTCNNFTTTNFTVYSQPEITVPPSPNPVSYCKDVTATALTVTANGGSDKNELTINTYSISMYAWYSNTAESNSGGLLVGSGPTMSSYIPVTTNPGTLYYYCVVTNNFGCSIASSISGPVTVYPPIDFNYITGYLQVCSGIIPSPITGTLPTGGNGSYAYKWESSPDNGTYSIASGTYDQQDYQPGPLTSNTWFRRTVTSDGCTSQSDPTMVTVIQGPYQYTLTGDATICSGTSASITLTGSATGVKYQLTNNSGNIGDPVDGTGNPITWSTGNLGETTIYNVLATDQSTLCSIQMTGPATITVIPEITENNISTSSLIVCPGNIPEPLYGSIPQNGDGNYFYTWLSSTDGQNFTDAGGIIDNQDYSPDALTVNTWYQRKVVSGPCFTLSNIIKITPNPLPAQVTVEGPIGDLFCSSATLTAKNGGDGIIYYQGTTPNNKDVRFPQTSVIVYSSGTYYFRAFNPNTGCWGPDGSITVSLTLPPATIGATICQGGVGTMTLANQCPSPITTFTAYAQNGADDGTIGTIGWTNTGNISTAGSPYATAPAIPSNGGISHYLFATNFGFNIPTGSTTTTIRGVAVTINRSSSGNSSPYLRDNVVKLVRGGAVAGNSRGKTGTDWPTSMQTASYGGPTDTWGITGLSATDINSSNFGVALSAINSNSSIYPVVAATNTSSQQNAVTTHTVALPAGIHAGDLLLIFWSNSRPGFGGNSVTAPADWTLLYQSDASNESRIAWYKIATGSEGASISVTTSNFFGVRSAHNSYRIAAGTYQGVPVHGTVATGSSTNPNPPSLTPVFGSSKTLWIAASHSLGASTVTAPASYGILIQSYTGATGNSNATMATATRFLEAASEDPDLFTLSSSLDWAANTIAIQGSSNAMDANVDYIQVTVTAQVNGVLNWYTSAVGGTYMGSGAPFNPVGKPGGLTDTNTSGKWTYYSECSNVPGCRTATDFIINPVPDAPVAGSNTHTYDGLIHTMAASVSQPNVTVDWYNGSGALLAQAPTLTNAGSVTAYAEARNTITGCVSPNRTSVTLTINPLQITVTPAAGQSKIFGEGNPTYTYGYTPALVGLDAFSGALSRDAGEDVGLYNITQGDLALSSNYTLTFVSGVQFEIKKLEITVTPASGQSKIFGTADPTYTYGYTPALIGSDAFSGALTRDAGEDVGSYNITQGDLALSSNYTLTFVTGVKFAITKKVITVTPISGQSKTYGDGNPTYTYSYAPALEGTDAFSGALSRVSGEDVGLYDITQGTLALSGNYTLTFVPGVQFEIKKLEITVTPTSGQSKTFGAADPAYTYGYTPALIGSDAFSGALSRDPGEDVGLYNITQGTLALSTNYTLTFVPGVQFEITKRVITVTPTSGQSKIFGATDPTYTYGYTPALVGSDAFTGALSRDAGEDVGLYNITQGDLALGSNYTLTFVSGVQFEIKKLEITVTPASGQSKIFGTADPTYTYGYTPALIGSDAFSGALSRDAGEDVGSYNITQGDLALSSNYTLTFVTGVKFAITKKVITVTPISGQSKTYGDGNPTYTYSYAPALEGTDAFSGALSRVSGEDVGLYDITQGTLALSGNYTLTFVPGVQFEIKKLEITVTPTSGQSKTFGTADPAYTYGYTPALIGSDAFSGALARDPGEDVGLYNITQGDLALSTNYTLTFVTGVQFEITKRVITVTPTSGQTKTFGDGDPTYTYGYTPSLVGSDAFTGALSRDAGEDVGLYNITQGDLALGSNYTLTFVTGVQFEIKKLEITVTPASGQSKIFGTADPTYTYGYTPALIGSDAFSGALSRDAGEDVGSYNITQGDLALSSNYTLTFVTGVKFAITQKVITVTPISGQSKTYGDGNPTYTYSYAPALEGTDAFSGTLSRDPGEDVGLYDITQGTLALSGNYTLTFVPGVQFEIKKLEITVTPTSGQTKTFGAADPAYTYGYTPALIGSDAFSGALARDPGEDVGLYNITQGDLALSTNYTLTFVTGVQFEITKRVITVTPTSGQSKIFGATDPTYTYGYTPALVGSDAFSGALSRVSGEDVGLYNITQGDLALGSNYTLTFVTGVQFEIKKLEITVTPASGQSKIFGTADPTYTYGYTPALIGSDAFSGALSRDAGEDVGSYNITQGDLALSSNYTLTFVTGVKFAITQKVITVTPISGQSKTYGDGNPTYTYSYAPALEGTDAFSGALSRVSGEDVGLYDITQGTLALSGNYTLTFVPGVQFEIKKLEITVTPTSGQSKTFGAADPAYTYGYTPALIGSDAFSGALSRDPGEDVGLYNITQGTLALSTNYTLTFVPGVQFEITKRVITVTPTSGQSKIFGATDPTYIYGYTPALVGSDAFSGALSRDAGEDVGLYNITQGDLALGSNYTLTFVSGVQFEIKKLEITVTPASGQTKIFGTADPIYTYGYTPALIGSDAFSGALTRDAGEDVGSYNITQGDLALSSNYTLTFVTGVKFAITKKEITVTPISGQSKTYGDGNPTYTYSYAPALEGTDAFSGTLSRDPGEDVGMYNITQGTLALSGNYTLTFVPGVQFEIKKLEITVTPASGQSKTFGAADPTYTYGYTPALVGSDAFSGALTRDPGEDVGLYNITQGTLALSGNYTLTFVSGVQFEITKRVITVTADPKTKDFGQPDPVFTYQITSGNLVNGDTFTGALARDPGEDVGTYAITQGTLALSSNYTLNYVGALLTIENRIIIVTADPQTKMYGDADPVLTYKITSGTLQSGDTFSGSLTRDAGNDVGSYNITQGTLSLPSKYILTFVGATLDITKKPLAVTAVASYVNYGDMPVVTVTYNGFVGTDDASVLDNVGFILGSNYNQFDPVGTYHTTISIGSATDNNYSFAPLLTSSFGVGKADLAVTAVASDITYGGVPVVTVTYNGFKGTDNASVLDNVGFILGTNYNQFDPVGTYHTTIAMGTAMDNNYNFTPLNTSTFSVGKANLAVTAVASYVDYGQMPVVTVTYNGFKGTDNASVLDNVGFILGSNYVLYGPVGTYHTTIAMGTATDNNYNFTPLNTSTFDVGKRLVTITADPKSKVYGDADPALTYKITSGSLVGSDAFSGALTRDAGKNVGTYAIRQGTLALSSNYTLSYIGANLTITPRQITIYADCKTKTYGNPDPALTYQITSGNLIAGDVFSGALTRDAGENVGIYTIRQGTLALSSNYTITYYTGQLTITGRSVTVAADPKSKVYGTADPALTYHITSGTLVGADAFSGALVRDAGENVGTYSIRKGTLALSSNYTLAYAGANLTITGRPITITADPKSKVYGNVDPVFTYKITSGSLIGGDLLSGALARTMGENVGIYPVNIGSLANGNYTIVFNSADMTITPLGVSVNAEPKTKAYGDADPALTFVSVPPVGSVLANGEVISFTGSLSRAAGENIGNYPIGKNTIANSNYTIIYTGASLNITQRVVTVCIEAKSKTYGDPDPVLTYHLSAGSLAFTDSFTGALTRDAGENVGTYAIKQGTLALSFNYNLTFTGANLTITERPITITTDAKSKVYGQVDPVLTYHISSGTLAFSDNFAGELVRAAGENVGNYAILPGTVVLNDNYNITWVGAKLTITPLNVAVTADAQKKVYGDPDPALTFVSVPAIGSALPDGELISFTGILSRVSGENPGLYAILQNTLDNSNYHIEYTGADLEITLSTDNKPIDQSKVGLKVYPNPFADHLYFELQWNRDARAVIEIYNIIGTKVATIFSENVEAFKNYRIDYTPENVSSGMLIYHLIIDGEVVFTGKAVHAE